MGLGRTYSPPTSNPRKPFMPAATFKDFCLMLCSLIDVTPPDLTPDAQGVVGFTVDCQGASVNFMEGEYGSEPGLLMSVMFGAPPADQELEVLRSLMDANFLLAGMMAPAFVRNPATGEIALHQSYLLSQVDVQGIYQGIANAAAAVEAWREDPMLLSSQLPDTQAVREFDSFA